MYELIIQKIQVASSIILMSASYLIAQFPMIENGYDQLLSLGLLITAVIVVWKAFSAKDASETQILRTSIEVQQETIKAQRKHIERQDVMHEELQTMFKDLQESLRKEKAK